MSFMPRKALTRIFHTSLKNARRVPTFVGVSREGIRPASCFPCSLRRVNISQVYKLCEMFRLNTLSSSATISSITQWMYK